MSEETKKEGFFRKVLKSVKDFDKYEDFALEKPGEAFKYLLKIIAILSAIICVVYTYKILDNMNNLYTGIKERVPEFSYENGELKTESGEPIIIEDYGSTIGTIIIDTEIESAKVEETYYENNIVKYGSGYVFTKDNLILYNSALNGQVSYKYVDLLQNYNIQNFTKQELINNIDGMIISLKILAADMIMPRFTLREPTTAKPVQA